MVEPGEKLPGSFQLMTCENQNGRTSNCICLKCLESSSQLAQLTDVGEKLQRLQITSNYPHVWSLKYFVKYVFSAAQIRIYCLFQMNQLIM